MIRMLTTLAVFAVLAVSNLSSTALASPVGSTRPEAAKLIVYNGHAGLGS